MAEIVASEVHKCLCCGRRIKIIYRFCVGCELKRRKIFDDCLAAGMFPPEARAKVEAAYPQKF